MSVEVAQMDAAGRLTVALGRIKKINDVTAIATSKGNYDCNSYMLGMANGLLLAQAIMTDTEVVYLDKPETWLDDLPKSDAAPSSSARQDQQSQS